MTNSPSRTYVDMEALWKMRVPVPVSLLVVDGGFGWSCGQIALDADGQVVAAHDLIGQGEIVCDYVEEILRRGGLKPKSLVRAMLYYVAGSSVDETALVDVFRARFGPDTMLQTVPVPHFYYDGILLEVDVFCGAQAGPRSTSQTDDVQLESRSNGELTWVTMHTTGDAIPSGLSMLERELASAGLSSQDLLAARWLSPPSTLASTSDQLAESPWCPDPGAVVDLGPTENHVKGFFTFARSSTTADSARNDDGLVWRRRGRFLWMQSRAPDESKDILEQTRQIMHRIHATLDQHGLRFDNVAKSTAHYLGGSGAEDLHGNMNIRNSYYSKPGPASTGLPVYGFADAATAIAVDLVATWPEKSRS